MQQDSEKKEKLTKEGESFEQEISRKELPPLPERREISPQEKEIIKKYLTRELEMMKLDKELEREAEKKAQKISFLAQQDKIEHLLGIAKDKGLIFAVRVAQKMNDPYILDIFHDILAREGFFKKFIR